MKKKYYKRSVDGIIPPSKIKRIRLRSENPYIYNVKINNIEYYKVHFHRSDKSFIKYFHTQEEAELYLALCIKTTTVKV
jgi:hypothetical protein